MSDGAERADARSIELDVVYDGVLTGRLLGMM
jgi:hypothetical protein